MKLLPLTVSEDRALASGIERLMEGVGFGETTVKVAPFESRRPALS
jgi:hypothetical protein